MGNFKMFALNNSLQNNGEKSAVNIHKRPTNEPTTSNAKRHLLYNTHSMTSIMSQVYTRD